MSCGCLVVFDADETRCVAGGFGAVGDDAADELTAVVHLVVLQDGEVAVGGVGQCGGIEDGEDRDDAVDGLGVRRCPSR